MDPQETKSDPSAGSTSFWSSAKRLHNKCWRIFFGELPLQSETTYFILINVLDIFMTYILLRQNATSSNVVARESNPLANFLLEKWGFNGAIWFKLIIVASVCIIAQIVATRSIRTARGLLIAGSLLVGAVVIYSLRLYLTFYT